MLINSGCDINHQNVLGETGLMRALFYGASMQDILPTVTLLLEHGCVTDLVGKIHSWDRINQLRYWLTPKDISSA